jgi:Lrp/AsnC family transcriptional regulator for asnA, asnC and gidA
LSKFDLLDKGIITLLNRDARTSSASLARILGVPERTVNNRIKRLTAANIIQSVAVINPAAFGYTMTVQVFCDIEVGYQDQVVEAIMQLPEVDYLAISTGDQDLSVRAHFRDSEQMQEFITKKLHQIPGMRRTRTALIPRILKDAHQWLPPDQAFDRNSTVSQS